MFKIALLRDNSKIFMFIGVLLVMPIIGFMKGSNMQKLNQLAFSVATSILGGAIIFVLSVWNALTNFGKRLLDIFISVHPTVFERVDGSIFKNLDFILVNTVYALIDGFIFGLLFALLYNKLLLKFAAKEDLPVEENDQQVDSNEG